MKSRIIKNSASIFAIAAMIVAAVSAIPTFASSTNGTIDSIYKYAWSENVGWINFKADSGNVSIVDSGLSGYAWSSNYGWINLSPPTSGVDNDGSGNLSGYAWGENIGWIDFSGVTIDSNGYFLGYASSTVAGQISFNCFNTGSCASSDFKVRTDWRSRVERPACNNAIDDDGDGKIDYPNDPGCNSLDDDDETDQGGGFPPSSSNPPSSPPSSSDNPEGEFSVLINSGNEYTNSFAVSLKLIAGDDTEKMAISDNPEFTGASQITFQENIEWKLIEDIPDSLFIIHNSSYTVYAKFYTKYGQPSEVVSDSIILDMTAPIIEATNVKERYNDNEEIIILGTTEPNATVVPKMNGEDLGIGAIKANNGGNWILDLGKLAVGDFRLELKAEDLAGNIGETVIYNFEIVSFREEDKPFDKPTEKSTEPLEPNEPAEPNEPNIIEKITDKIIDIFKPKPDPDPEPEIPIEDLVVKETPISMQGGWNLLPQEQINEFVLAPLPKGLERLAKKFPELQETFEKVGINKITDLQKMRNAKLSLPGLFKSAIFSESELALLKSVPLSELSNEIKSKIPSEIIFAQIGGEKNIKNIDFDIELIVSDQGEIQQKITAVSRQKLFLTVRPEKKARSVYGYLAFKGSKNYELGIKSQELRVRSYELGIKNLVNSFVFARPVFAQDYDNIEEKFVTQKFAYADEDNDGLWTAEIYAPIVEGEYEIITIIEYEDPDLGTRMIKLTTVVDPEGYVYESIENQELRIKNADVSIYQLNSGNGEYELWQASDYNQKNPQTTDATGRYSFLVPKGTYYLAVEASGYSSYQSEPFIIQEGAGVHQNIELKAKNAWLKIIDWKVFAILLLFVLVVWNFWRDRKRS